MGAIDELSLEDVAPLAPGPRDVVVTIGASGVCHSDVSVLNGSSRLPAPVVLGHEAAGVVELVGPEVSRVKVGDRVIASLTPMCGTCWHCRRNETHLCEMAFTLMMTPRFRRPDGSTVPCLSGLGTFAEQMTVNEQSLVRVETDLPDEQIALLGCGVTTGLGAVLNSAPPPVGASVAVIGCGGVGTAAIQGAKLAGASRVIAIDPVRTKRELALKLGATDAVDPYPGDPVAQVKVLCGGRGVDLVIEAVGSTALVEQALAMTRRGGTSVLLGAPPFGSSVSIDPAALVVDDRTIKGSFYGDTRAHRDLPAYIELIESGRLDLSSMVSQHISLEELPVAMDHVGGEAVRTVVVAAT
jgi:S-(hydroxymethyl)glutathione dehydrogenase/alcohol dehydrogenase